MHENRDRRIRTFDTVALDPENIKVVIREVNREITIDNMISFDL